MPTVTPEEAASRRTIKAVHATKRGQHFEEGSFWDGQLYRPGVKLDLARGRLYTESFKTTEGQPWVVRRAKALAHYLEHCPLYLPPGQRLCGGAASSEDGLPWPVEKHWKWLKDAVHGGALRSMVDEKDLNEFDAIVGFWSRPMMTEWDREEAAIPAWLKKYYRWDGTLQWSQYDSSGQLTFENIWAGIDARLEAADSALEQLSHTLPSDYVHRKINIEAMAIVLKAAKVYARRYAEYCGSLAAEEEQPLRRQQLTRMAAICDWVPANPPRDFEEALQAFWTVNAIRGAEGEGLCIPDGRFDVEFGPYWEKSKANGMTREEGVELIEWFMLKLAEQSTIYSPMVAQVYGGGARIQNLCLGGVDAQGNDVTNDLTYMAMDAAMKLKLQEPNLSLRVHPGTPDAVIVKALDCIKLGLGYPSFFNDNGIIPQLTRRGLPLQEARNYFAPFCAVVSLRGRSTGTVWPGWLNWAKCVWWALMKGVDPKTGDQKGAVTKDPLEWVGYDDMLQAYLDQLRFFADKHNKLVKLSAQNNRVYMNRPFNSAFAEDSLERGLMLEEWSNPYSLPLWPVVGPVNAANSIAAIKKRVFDEKRVKMADLIEALRRNWEGDDELRQSMLSAPKYGNDDDYADAIAAEVQEKSTEVMESFTDYNGRPYWVNGTNAATIFGFSWDTDATPEGRCKGDMLADGTASPMLGTDIKGPTAVLRSAARVNTPKTYCHLLNQKLAPALVKNEKGKQLFCAYIRSWMELGVTEVQFNLVDRDTMIDAQRHPNDHRGLIVRVAGYSAYFIDLSKGMQDSIIARTEHGCWTEG
ncbi:MAG: pyruvate formate lyase family protein [Candidatus Binatia bacterium]